MVLVIRRASSGALRVEHSQRCRASLENGEMKMESVTYYVTLSFGVIGGNEVGGGGENARSGRVGIDGDGGAVEQIRSAGR